MDLVYTYAAGRGHLETPKWVTDMRRKLTAEPLICKDIENTIITFV